MANLRSSIPYINPVKMVPVDYTGYVDFDKSTFREQVPSFMPMPIGGMHQVWHLEDEIRIQVQSQLSPVTMARYNCQGHLQQTYSSTVVPSTAVPPGWQVFEFSIFPPDTNDTFFFVLNLGEAEMLSSYISNPQRIVRRKDTSVLFKYKDTRNRHGVIFSTGIEFQFRCYGGFDLYEFAAQMAEFTDQRLNLTTVSGKPYRSVPLIVGSSYGAPSYQIDQVNRILCADTVTINNKAFTRPAGSEWEVNKIDNYPMAGYRIVLREKFNHLAMEIDSENVLSEQFAVTYNIRTRGFGYLNTLSPNINVTKFE